MVPKYRVFAKAGVKTVYGGWYDTAQMFYEIRDIDFYEKEVTVWGCHHKNCGICDDTYKVEDVGIMVSTGLKDKNGVEIFEGDIVKVHRFQQGHVGGNYGVVEVEEEMVCVVEKATVEPYIYPCEWFLVDVYDEEPENLWLSSGLHEESYEVIGNIFENESLLKELE